MELDFGDEPEALCLSADERLLFVANRGSNSVTIIDLATMSPRTKVSVGSAPLDLGVDPNSERVYVVNSLSDNVTVFDPQNVNQTYTLAVGSFPTSIVFEPRLHRAYISNYYSGELTEINVEVMAVSGKFSLNRGVRDVAADAFADVLYCAVEKSNLVMAFRPSLNVVLAEIPVGAAPRRLSLDPEGVFLYVCCGESNTISVINKTSGRVERVIASGLKPYAIVFP